MVEPTTRSTIDRIAPIAGNAAPVLYFAFIAVLGSLEPGYSHLTDLMSLLGGVPGPRGTLFNLGVGVTGILIILFAIGLGRRLQSGRASKTATALLVLGGVGMIGASVFPCKQGCTNILQEPDLAGYLHSVFSLFAGVGTGLATFAYWAAMRRHSTWQRLAPATLVTAILANGAGILFWLQLLLGWRTPMVEGLIQRFGLVFTLIWVFFIAMRMRRPPG